MCPNCAGETQSAPTELCHPAGPGRLHIRHGACSGLDRFTEAVRDVAQEEQGLTAGVASTSHTVRLTALFMGLLPLADNVMRAGVSACWDETGSGYVRAFAGARPGIPEVRGRPRFTRHGSYASCATPLEGRRKSRVDDTANL